MEIRTIGPNAVVIEWGIPESDGGAPLEGYNIAIRDVKKTMWMEVGRVHKGVQKFTLKDLQEDHEYLIRIFARNEVGLSDPLESDEPFKVLPSTGKYINVKTYLKELFKPVKRTAIIIINEPPPVSFRTIRRTIRTGVVRACALRPKNVCPNLASSL